MTSVRRGWLRLVVGGRPKFKKDDGVLVDGRKGTIVALYPDTGGEQQYSVKTPGGFTKAREQNLSKIPTDSLTGVSAIGYSSSMEKSAAPETGPEYSFVVDKYDDEAIKSGPWSSRQTAIEQMGDAKGLKVVTLPRWGAENPLCPDHSSHSENVAERLFGSIRGGRNEDEDITLDCFTEAEYRDCEGHS